MTKTKEDRAKAAIEFSYSGHCCSQSVALALCDDDQDIIGRAAAGFCGGMAVGDKCGVVTGMLIAAGILYGDYEKGNVQAKAEFGSMLVDLQKLFTDEFSTDNCLALKDIVDKYMPISPNWFEGEPQRCSPYVKRAVEIFCDYTKLLKKEK